MSNNDEVIKKTTNTYEAAYYIMQGGKLVDVNVHKIPNLETGGESEQWIMEISGVHVLWISLWFNDRAFGNLHSFSVSRKSLKAQVRKLIKQKHS